MVIPIDEEEFRSLLIEHQRLRANQTLSEFIVRWGHPVRKAGDQYGWAALVRICPADREALDFVVLEINGQIQVMDLPAYRASGYQNYRWKIARGRARIVTSWVDSR